MKSIEFIGVPTGDNECFCWEVDEENFIKATNEIPDEIMNYIGGRYSYKDEKFIGGKLVVYPDSIFSKSNTEKKMRIKISFEELN